MTDRDSETYLGDGAYCSYDGWQFCLRAPREDGDHVVFLEPRVLASFIGYARHMLGDDFDCLMKALPK